jgi:glycosyltransferase involved in cell wall biosynthesis
MRIVFATEYYPPFAPGGSPWSIQLLAEALAASGHTVSVVTPNYGAAAREAVGGVSIVRFPCGRRVSGDASLAPTRFLVGLPFHVRLARAVAAEGRRIGADLVHAQDKHALVGTFLAGRRLRRPVFLTVRDTGLLCPIVTCLLTHDFVPADCSAVKLQRECLGFYLQHYIPPGFVRRLRVRASALLLYLDARLKRFFVRHLDGVVGVSQGLLEIYLRAGYGRRERSHVVYSLPPPSRAPDPAQAVSVRTRLGLDNKTAILYVGKLSLGKGGPVFLQAAEQVGREFPDAVFVVAGPDRPPALEADVRWLGRMPHDELLDLYAAVDVVVVPSVGPEALSRVPLEAAAAGRATIGARAGGIPEEIADGDSGILVARGDAGALAAAMARVIGDGGLRRRLGDNARRFLAARFSRDEIVKRLLEVYACATR